MKCCFVPLPQRSTETLGLARPLGVRVGQPSCGHSTSCQSVDSQLTAAYSIEAGVVSVVLMDGPRADLDLDLWRWR